MINNGNGQRLKKQRRKKNITMEELAEMVGYTASNRRSVIYQIESGRADIPVSKLPEYAHALGTNIYYLLGMTDVVDYTDADVVRLITKAAKR